MSINRAAKPTRRQLSVLGTLDTGPATPAYLGVRSDVLWRMEERGWVTSGSILPDRRHERYTITAAGREVLEAHEATE